MNNWVDHTYRPLVAGEQLWGCRYSVARSGFRVNVNVPPVLLTVSPSYSLMDAKGISPKHMAYLFTNEADCRDYYTKEVAGHLRDLAYIVSNVSSTALKAIKRCPSVAVTQEFKELIDSFHEAAADIK